VSRVSEDYPFAIVYRPKAQGANVVIGRYRHRQDASDEVKQLLAAYRTDFGATLPGTLAVVRVDGCDR